MVGLSDVKNEINHEIETLAGFCSRFRLENSEVELVKDIIKEQWLNVIKQHESSLWKQFDRIEIGRAHV